MDKPSNYQDGYQRGYSIASDVADDRLEEHRTKDAFLEDCYLTEDNARQFSPFEFTATHLSKVDGWDAFEEGINDGIAAVATEHFPED